ncbi:hypothetical protein [Planomonospora venezuelensis]|uniref:Uncharacterized protein n=1 Tax=Planomonospora venezuelensis TaxID=1999 RepID=A0A841DG03_PLAVE|nr:hypothetical protein [Planomonospora venezuelensis]MBB5966156.1 hypothetical protein [Planomonospora venezuelensis]GIN05813.1 hypothetical protein Pve01_74710 [Planomonospora venezuelensis]
MNLEIAALSQVATWPGADRRTRIVLANQFMSAGLDREGFEFFSALSARTPGDGLLLALTGAFQSRLEGGTEEAIARLDAGTSLDLGLPHYFRGTSLAGLPECAGRAETVVADLEAEGSAEGLFEAMQTVMDLRPRQLVHGHTALTENYTIEAFPGLLAALRDLERFVAAGIADGLTLVEILQLNHLPDVLREHPAAVMPYLVTRDNFIQRPHRQRTGYWHRRGEGIEHFAPAELAAALDLLGGGNAAAFSTAGLELARRGEQALALHLVDLGLLSHAGAPGLVSLRRRLLDSLVAQNQTLNPFKFMHYAALADLELAPAG